MIRRLGMVAAALAFGLLLAAAATRPLLWTPGSLPVYRGPNAPLELEDRNLNVWILAWLAHAANAEPARLFDGNIYAPAPNTLAGSETMLAHLPLTALVWRWTGDATWVLKAEMAWGIAGTALAVGAVVFAVSGAPWAALIAAAAVALEPGRVNPAGTDFGIAAQPQYLGFQYAPLALLALVRLRRRPWVGAIGFGLALGAQALACFYLGYYAFLTLPLAGAALLLRDRPRALLALAVGTALGATLVLPVASQYLAARAAGAVRLPNPVLAWIGSIGGAGLGAGLRWIGPAAVLLGAVACFAPRAARAEERDLVFAAWVVVAAGFVLALGPELHVGGAVIPLPHRLLARLVPGFGMLRGPIRALSLSALGLAAAGGCALARLGARWSPARRALAVLIGIALALGWLAHARVPIDPAPLRADLPEVYRWLRDRPRDGVVLEVPGAVADEDLAGLVRESGYMLYSTVHWQRLVNGYTAYPPIWSELAKSLAARLPDPDALQTLVNLAPLRLVVVHRDALPDAQRALWDAGADAAGLVEERRFGGDVAYRVTRPPTADWRAAPGSLADDRTLEGTPTAPLAGACLRASLEASLPEELPVAIGVQRIPVDLTNMSGCVWPALAVRPTGLVMLTTEWLDAPEGSVPPAIRARLPHDLAPGAAARVDALVLTPRVPGDYRLRVLLAQDGGAEPLASFAAGVRVVAPSTE